MLRVMEFHITEQVNVRSGGHSIDYGLFPSYWANYMLRSEITDIHFASSHSEYDGTEEAFVNQLLQSSEADGFQESSRRLPSKTTLQISYNKTDKYHDLHDHTNDLRQFAGLIGGSFVHSYIPNHPIPIPVKQPEEEQQYLFYLPRERLNAESLQKWLLTIPMSLRATFISQFNFTKLDIHRADWYGIKIQSSLHECSSKQPSCLEAKLSFTLFLKDSKLSSPPASPISFQSPYTPNSSHFWNAQERYIPLRQSNTNLFRSLQQSCDTTNTNDEFDNNNSNSCITGDNSNQILAKDRSSIFHRYAVNYYDNVMRNSLQFQVVSSVNIPQLVLPQSHTEDTEFQTAFIITETIPPYYIIDISSYQYRWCSQPLRQSVEMFSCSSSWMDIHSLGNITVSNPSCAYETNCSQRGGQRIRDDFLVHDRCQRTISVHLKGIESEIYPYLQLRYDARKQFVHTDLLPPDASYGVVIPPMFIFDQTTMVMQWSSSSLLATYPIPDRTMPYNVLTMVGTLSSFILGSFLNLLLRRWHLAKASSTAKQ